MAAFRRERRAEWERVVSDPKKGNHLRRLKPGANPDGFKVRLRALPPRTVAYLRMANAYSGDR